MKKMLRSLIRPKVFIPLVLAIALIAALISFSDLRKVVKLMEGFQRIDLLYYFLLMIGYEFVRGVQWRYTMVTLGVKAPMRTEIFAYVLSEVTKILPIGNYFQNYVLQVSKGVDFGLTSAATTLVVLEEVAVGIVGVVILGLGSWTTWLRLVIIIGLAVFAVVVWLLSRYYHGKGRPDWIKRRSILNDVADEFVNFRKGAETLLTVRSISITMALSIVYLLMGGAALFVVVRALGDQQLSFSQALAVYLFSLAFSLIFPLPIDFGVLEVSGVGAFLAVGAARNTAFGAVFANRILNTLSAIVIAAVVVAFLHGEVRPLFTHMTGSGADSQGRDDGNETRGEQGEGGDSEEGDRDKKDVEGAEDAAQGARE